jgi:hypothetical protein
MKENLWCYCKNKNNKNKNIFGVFNSMSIFRDLNVILVSTIN